MSDAFVFPCTKLPKRPFWKSRPNYSLEYAGGAYKQPVPLDFESIPDYPRDRDQWMSSQIQFHLPNTVEHVSPFSMSSILPHLKRSPSTDIKSVPEAERPSTSTNQANLTYVVPDAPDSQPGNGRGQASRYSDPFGLPAIPERSSAAEADNGHSLAESHVHEEDDSFTHSNTVPVLMAGPGSNSSTHSGLTSDSAPRTPPIEAQKDYFAAAPAPAQPHDRPDGYSHEAYPPAPHSYISSPSTLYLRDSWSQFVLDAQSQYVSASGSVHGTELRSNKPPSTIEERGEKWTGEVPNVWSLFSATPTSGVMQLPPSPPPLPQTLTINPIFAHILWDVRYPPASASLITAKLRNAAKHLSELWSDDEGSTRPLSKVEVMAPATYPPKCMLLISSPHTRWRARVIGESPGPDAPSTYVSVADVLHALHEQLSLRFVKQSEWDKLDARTRWYSGRAYGRNRLMEMSDAGSISSGFSGSAAGEGQSMRGSVWSEGSRMSGESVMCGPGVGWGEGLRRADVLRDRTIFAGLKVDPAYKGRVPGEDGMSHLVMQLRRHDNTTSAASVA